MSGGMFAHGFVGLLSTGLYIVVALAFVSLGLTHVRRVHAMSGFALAGAGALLGLDAVVGQIASFAIGLGGMSVYVVVQIVTLLMRIAAAVLTIAAIFMLAGALKQGSRPGPGY